MDINFTCPHCKQTLVVDSAGAGETVSCPSCDQTILVPVDYIPKDNIPNAKNTEVNQPVETEQQSIAIDEIRNSARLAIEDHWRNFFILVHIDKRKALESVHSLNAKINMMTEYMPEPDASLFRASIEVERKNFLDEYERNPEALKARLGVTNQMRAPMRSQNRQGLEELVVRTAVRATVWESVRSIFRLFR